MIFSGYGQRTDRRTDTISEYDLLLIMRRIDWCRFEGIQLKLDEI